MYRETEIYHCHIEIHHARTKISRAHSVGKYDAAQINNNKKADNRHAQSKLSYKVALYHIPNLRGRRHRNQRHKLPTSPYEARKRHGHAGRRVQRRGRFISEVKGNESVRVPIGNTSAPLLWSVLCLLSCRNKKVRPPAGDQSNSEKTN